MYFKFLKIFILLRKHNIQFYTNPIYSKRYLLGFKHCCVSPIYFIEFKYTTCIAVKIRFMLTVARLSI